MCRSRRTYHANDPPLSFCLFVILSQCGPVGIGKERYSLRGDTTGLVSVVLFISQSIIAYYYQYRQCTSHS
jgi:hypothetical protein